MLAKYAGGTLQQRDLFATLGRMSQLLLRAPTSQSAVVGLTPADAAAAEVAEIHGKSQALESDESEDFSIVVILISMVT